MKQFITDIEGTQIEVTNLPEAIKQAEMFSKFDVHDTERTKYWKHMLEQLQNLKPLPEPKPIVKEEKESELFFLIRKVRENRLKCLANMGYDVANLKESKLFMKDTKASPLYGLHSCARVRHHIRNIDALEIGESCTNGSGRNITRVF